MVYMIRVTISINLLAMVTSGGKKGRNSTSECIESEPGSDSDGPEALPDVRLFQLPLLNNLKNYLNSLGPVTIGIDRSRV